MLLVRCKRHAGCRSSALKSFTPRQEAPKARVRPNNHRNATMFVTPKANMSDRGDGRAEGARCTRPESSAIDRVSLQRSGVSCSNPGPVHQCRQSDAWPVASFRLLPGARFALKERALSQPIPRIEGTVVSSVRIGPSKDSVHRCALP